jgi:hypothetical protein
MGRIRSVTQFTRFVQSSSHQQWGNVRYMRDLLILTAHLLVTVAKLLRPGGVRAVAAESLLLKHQLLISNRARQRAPNLTPTAFDCRRRSLRTRPDHTVREPE